MAGENVPDLTINNLNVPTIRGFSNALDQIKSLTFNDTFKVFSKNDEPDLNNKLHSNNIAIYDKTKDSFVNIFSDNGTLKYNDYSLLDSNNVISELNSNIDDFELVVNSETNSLDYLNVSNLKILGNDFDDASSTTYKVYVTINDSNKGGGVNASSISIGNTATIGVNSLTKALSTNDIITFFNGAKFTLTQNALLGATTITGQLTINTIATGQIGTIDKTEEISTNIPYLNFTSESGENGHGLRYNPTTGQVQYKNLGGAGWTNISAAFLDIKLSCVIATTDNLSAIYNQISIDSTSNSKDIFLSNGSTYTSNHRSVNDKALDFNGTTNFVTVPHVLSIKSISFWIYSTETSLQTLFNFVSSGDPLTEQHIKINTSLSNVLNSIQIINMGEHEFYINGNNNVLSNIGINQWHHIVINFDLAFTTVNPFYIATERLPFINSDTFNNYYKGKLSDIRFYDTVLTQVDVTNIFNNDTILGNELAIYKFEKDKDNLGVGATLVSDIDGAFPTTDGVTLNTTGKRIIVKDQTDKKQNGIYQLSTVGDENTRWILTRTTDADTPAKLNAAAFTVVEIGTVGIGKSFVFLPSTDPVDFGTTEFDVTLLGSSNAITHVNNPSDNSILTISNQSNTILDAEHNLTFDGTDLVVVGNTKTNTLKSQVAGTGLDIQFDGETTKNKITLTNNLADALNINENSNSYMKFITTNGSEQIVFGQNSTFTGTTIADLGTVSSALFTDLSATNLLVNREEANITSSGAQTYLIANLKKGLIRRDCGGSSVSDIIDTAANIVAGLTNAQVGTSFEFVVENNSDSDETITITGGSGITLYGNMTIKQNKAKSFLAVITNIGSGTEAVSIYQLGGGGGDLNDLGDVELNTNKNGTMVNSPTFTTNNVGYPNQALQFNGTSNYINLPHTISGIKSVSIWFYTTSVAQKTIVYLNSTTYIEIIEIDGNAKINARGLAATPNIYLNKVAETVTNSSNDNNGSTTLLISAWYHIVITTTTAITTDNPFYLAKRGNDYFNGKIDDFRIYSSTLGTNVGGVNQIEKAYNKNIVGTELAIYKFNEGNGNITTDSLNSNFYIANIPQNIETNEATFNTSIGIGALNSLTRGDHNTVLGYNAGNANTTGDENVFIGHKSGYLNSEGSRNTFVGEESGQNNTTGNENVFIGNNSGYSNNGGSHNTFVGEESGQTNTTGDENVFVGHKSGHSNSDGGDNTFVGQESGQNNTTGDNNSFFGEESGKDNQSGSDNTFIGQQGGHNNVDGNDNIAIGSNTQFSSTSATNQIVIGKGATGVGDNSVTLGNSDVKDVYCSQNKGATLHSTTIMLTETSPSDVSVLSGFGGLWVNSVNTPNELYFTNSNNDNIQITSGTGLNIGSSNLDSLTDVKFGGIDFTDSLLIGHTTTGTPLNAAKKNLGIMVGSLSSLKSGDDNIAFGFNAGNVIRTGNQNICIGSETDPSSNDGTNQIVIGHSTTGIGNNSVTLGNANVTDVYCSQDSGANLYCGNIQVKNSTTSSATEGGSIRLFCNDGAVMSAGHRLGVIEFAGAEDTSNTITVGARIEALCDATWSATENGADLLFYTTDSDAAQSEKMRILAGGNIGIGTTSPDSLLEISKDIDGELIALKLTNQSDAADTTGKISIQFDLEDTSGNTIDSGKIQVLKEQSFTNTGSTQDSSMAFYTSLDGTLAEKMRLTSKGTIKLKETASPVAVTATYGQLWVKTATPNQLYFTTADGDDIQITSGTGLNAGSSNLDSLTDVKFGGTNFGLTADPSLFIGTNTPGSAPQTDTNFGTFGQDTERNIAIGKNALKDIQYLNDSVAIGHNALQNVKSASYNTAIGSKAGANLKYNDTTGHNTYIGYNSGDPTLNPSSTSRYNVCIGAYANLLADSNDGSTCNNQISIGYNTIAQSNNSVTLGNANVTDIYCSQDKDAKVHAGGLISKIETISQTDATAVVLDMETHINFHINISGAGPYTINIGSPGTHTDVDLAGQSGQIYVTNGSTNPSTITWGTNVGWFFESDGGGNIIVPNITGVANAIDVFNYIILIDDNTPANRKILVTKANHFQHYT